MSCYVSFVPEAEVVEQILNVGFWPKTAIRFFKLSVSFGESRRSDCIFQRLLTTQRRPSESKNRGLLCALTRH